MLLHKIFGKRRKSLPRILYKYRPVNKYSLEIFSENELYFGDPVKDFNDPFDCQSPFDFSGDRNDFIREAKRVHDKFGLPINVDIIEEKANTFVELRNKGDEAYKKLINELADDVITIKKDQLGKQRIGILSMSERNDDILMFYHYADNHRGLCIGFDIDNDLDFFVSEANKVILLNVNYKRLFKPPNYFRSSDEEKFRWKLFTKARQWEYECEWRAANYNGSGIYKFHESCLSEIIFGCRMPVKDKHLICSLIKNRKHPISLYEARKKEKAFGLEIVKIEESKSCMC